MVRYFLTDLRGNPIYSFAQRLRRNNNLLQHRARLLSTAIEQQQTTPTQSSNPTASATTATTVPATSTTTLLCLIRNHAWPDVLAHIAKHPDEVAHHPVDPVTGDTVLHVTCRQGHVLPASVVRALLPYCSGRIANAQGATPLHTAVSHRCSASVLQVLLFWEREEGAENPQEQQRHSYEQEEDYDEPLHTSPTADLSRMGRAPIHYACLSFRGLDMEAFRCLVDATLQDGNVWVRHRQERGGHDDMVATPYPNSSATTDLGHIQSIVWENSVVDEAVQKDETEEAPCPLPSFLCEFGPLDEENPDLHSNNHSSHTGLYLPGDDLTVDESAQAPVLVNVMGLKDATGQTPLSLLFRRYRERVRSVISTVDRLRDTYSDDQQRASLVAAIRVHADLGELWEKARYIIARLTEERLQREHPTAIESSSCNRSQPQRAHDGWDNNATSRRATYFGTAKSSAFYDPTADPPSPGATAWALETHREIEQPTPEDDVLLPLSSIVDDIPTSSFLVQPSRKFRIVHASVGLTGYGCPPELIRLAISIHPHQVMEMDEDGNLPIHIAATAASYLATAQAAVGCHDMGAFGDDNHSVLSALSFFSSATVSQTTNPFDKVIKILLQQYPDAARIPHGRTGRLPLVMAIESGRRTWADGVATLLHAYPPALHHRKVVEPHVFPEVLARVGTTTHVKETSTRAQRHTACARSTLFQLIRTKPNWVTRGHVKEEAMGDRQEEEDAAL